MGIPVASWIGKSRIEEYLIWGKSKYDFADVVCGVNLVCFSYFGRRATASP